MTSSPPDRTLGHFATFSFTAAFWELPAAGRGERVRGALAALAGAAPRVEAYQVYPARHEAELLLWSALPADAPEAPGEFFRGFAAALAPHRRWLAPGPTLWGMTRPSPYVREPSPGTVDPLAGERLPYLVVYPFTKTHAWHALALEERRALMGEHIRVGRRHEGVRQLLLYAYGLGDPDFVVVYETADLAAFSDLVGELRATAARAYTAADTPVFTAVHRPPEDAAALWGGAG